MSKHARDVGAGVRTAFGTSARLAATADRHERVVVQEYSARAQRPFQEVEAGDVRRDVDAIVAAAHARMVSGECEYECEY